MKRRVVPILTATVALVLIAGLAYAAKKKEKDPAVGNEPDPTHEEEALQAELLEATQGVETRLPGTVETGAKKVARAAGSEKAKVQKARKAEQARDTL